MFIKRESIEKVKIEGNNHLKEIIESLVPNFRRSGSGYVGKCPVCGKEAGLSFSPAKGVYKCFHCGSDSISGKDAVKFVQTANNCTFPEAIKYIADVLHIYIETEEPKPEKRKGNTAASEPKSFLDEFMKGSGLTYKDIEVRLSDTEKGILSMGSPFKKGTVNKYGQIDKDGDDVIIAYYDLDGAPCKYEKIRPNGKGSDLYEYYRVRWQYPEEHPDMSGKPAKYHSPKGSGSFIYIPQYIRNKYHAGETIDRLYIQEGEKKAEKACKHGIPSVAISGITNIASKGKLSEDLIRIVQELQVKEVVMLYDSDWNDLSQNIKIKDPVEKRPQCFFYAAKNFKEWMRSMVASRNLYVEIYIGHIIKNERGDKGLDDLLCGTLKGKENLLATDLDSLIQNPKELKGEYVQLYKITVWTDLKLLELWSLNSPQAFAQAHIDELKDLAEFRLFRHTWRFNEKGELESAQSIEEEEKFWTDTLKVDRSGNERHEYSFNYDNCIRFLQNRGFGRHRLPNGRDFSFVSIEKPFVEEKTHHDVRDFVMDYAKTFAGHDVINMLMKGGPQFTGPDKLSYLEYVDPQFEKPKRDRQLFYFKDYCWEVTADNIKQVGYNEIEHYIWREQQRKFSATRTSPIFSVVKNAEDKFSLKVLNTDCQLLQFIINTSTFTWRKNPAEVTDDDIQENVNHMVAKICAIGYLCHQFKDRGVSRAVVAMDGKLSEVGQSNGRSGKSLIGEAIKRVLPYAYIDGKKDGPEHDTFYWNDVVEKTRFVFIDDVKTNFSLEPLFACITGDWNVNYKGGTRATFLFEDSPKIYITTNHAVNGTGSSYTDRQWKIAFSDFYNDFHKPQDDFGCLFFDEWDSTQWNLFWNFIAECVQCYLKFGVVESPSDRIEIRQLRQQMGETFLAWADEYYSSPEHLNHRAPRKILYDKYLEYSNSPRKYDSPSAFKTRIKAYAKYKGYFFNPGRLDPVSHNAVYFDRDGRPDLDDKMGGVEYITIGNEYYWSHNGASVPGSTDKAEDKQMTLPLSNEPSEAMQEFINEK